MEKIKKNVSNIKIKDPGSAITHFIAMLMALFAATPLIIKALSAPYVALTSCFFLLLITSAILSIEVTLPLSILFIDISHLTSIKLKHYVHSIPFLYEFYSSDPAASDLSVESVLSFLSSVESVLPVVLSVLPDELLEPLDAFHFS